MASKQAAKRKRKNDNVVADAPAPFAHVPDPSDGPPEEFAEGGATHSSNVLDYDGYRHSSLSHSTST